MLVFYHAFKRSIRYIDLSIYNNVCLAHLQVVIVISNQYCRSPYFFQVRLRSFKELIVVLFKRLRTVQNAGPMAAGLKDKPDARHGL